MIEPLQVAGLARLRVAAIAAAKHHMAAVLTTGELYTWGKGGDGRLGYVVGTQTTPRRCVAARARVTQRFSAQRGSPKAGALLQCGEQMLFRC